MALGGNLEVGDAIRPQQKRTYCSITSGGSRSKAPVSLGVEASSSMITNGSRHAELALAAKLEVLLLWTWRVAVLSPNLLLHNARRVDRPSINSRHVVLTQDSPHSA